jgi:hypothetical protein
MDQGALDYLAQAHGMDERGAQYLLQAAGIDAQTLEFLRAAQGMDQDVLREYATAQGMDENALNFLLQAANLDNMAMGHLANAQNMDLAAINVGQGFPGQISQAYGDVTGAGATSVNSRLSNTQTGNQTRQGTVNFMNAGNNALNTWLTALDTGFNNELDAYRTEQESSSGIGSIFGGLAGLVTSFMEEGGPVDEGMSPSGGAIPDDVPAQLTAGEFVIPREVVEWYGKQHFHKLIDKARSAQAIPAG